jgi:Flp pilus assembly protein TadD
LYLGKLAAPKGAWRTSLTSLVAFAGYNLAFGFLVRGIDNGAHLGGLVSGLLLGSVLSADFRQQASRQSRIRPVVFPAFAIVLVAGAAAVRLVHMPVVRLEHAEQQLRRGDAAGALQELTEVVKVRPNYVPAWMLLGSAYLRTQQDSQAEAAFQRAAQLNPKNPAVLAQLGVLYLRDKRYELARQAFQQVTELSPKDAEAQVNLGVALSLLGRTGDALARLRKATELNPNLPLAWYNIGIGSMKLQRYDDAVDAFTRATKLAPKDSEAWIWLANAYQAKGMTEQADAAYQTGYKLRAQTQRAPSKRQ